ncbi:MAG: glutathione peroxidase [Chitinophagales bacterium]
MEHSVYEYKLQSIKGGELDLSQFKGKKILLVNTASECGFTPQYKQLQELHENFADKVAVIGLPCDDFGGQEPGNESQIENFCEVNFGVTFPLTAKVKILGADMHPLYRFLTQKELNGYRDSEVKWNFQKYLIDENGKLIKIFSAPTDPLSDEVLNLINPQPNLFS